MILTNLTLSDFGVFRGSQSVSLSPSNSRPIILFGGKNGAGKTTLLEAIRLCLYGHGALGPRISKESYHSYLDSRIHSNPGFLIQPKFASIELGFQYANIETLHSYTVRRSWERRASQALVEHLDILQDGKPLEEIEGEHWQDFISDLIPRGLSQLFFFDGEKIQHLAEDSSDQQTLAEAVKSLLGLDTVDRLQTDFGIYTSRLTKLNQNLREATDLKLLEDEIENLNESIRDLQTDQEQHESKLVDLRSAISQVESKITSEGGSFARNRETLVRQQGELKASIGQYEDTVRQLSASLLPFALIPNTCLQLRDQLELEERTRQLESGRGLLKSAKEEIQERVGALEFWNTLTEVPDKRKANIIEQITLAIKKPVSIEQTDHVDRIHQLSEPDFLQLRSWIDRATDEIPKQLRSLAIDLDRKHRELHKVEQAIRKIPADEILKPLLEELHSLHKEMGGISKQLLTKEEEIRSVESKLAERQRRYNRTVEGLSSEAAAATRIHLVNRARKALEEYRLELLQKKVIQLQGAVSDCFNTLCRKKDELRKIVINPKDFSTTFYDKQNRPLPKAQLSAGEKQIYAISMLWALTKTAGRPLPMIIDTPLARLDSDHRRLLIHNYFPAASHQVIILSTDTEVDESYFSGLRSSIAQSYRLEFEPEEYSTKVLKGYFWKGRDETH